MENFEIEIKLPIEKPEEILEKLLGQGFLETGHIKEDDMYYNSEYHDVRKYDEALRIRKSEDLRTGEKKAQINFKGKKIDRVSMSRREYETGVEDPDQMNEILTAIGFFPAAGVEKIRRYLKRERMTACLDQVKGLGNFLELEVIVQEESQREKCLAEMKELLEKLGLSMKNTVRTSYLSMLLKKK